MIFFTCGLIIGNVMISSLMVGLSVDSLTGLKRKTCEGAGAGASASASNAARGVSVSPASSSTPSGSEPKIYVPSEDATQVVSSESGTPITVVEMPCLMANYLCC